MRLSCPERTHPLTTANTIGLPTFGIPISGFQLGQAGRRYLSSGDEEGGLLRFEIEPSWSIASK